CVGYDGFVIDGEIGEQLAHAAAVVVVADDAGEHDPGAQSAEHGGDAASAAKPFLAPFRSEQDDRRLLADALGVTPDVAVEHYVADHQYARLPQPLHEIDQILGHRSPSVVWPAPHASAAASSACTAAALASSHSSATCNSGH